MNDLQIRESFHRRMLRHYHARQDTLVVDELGLKHGKCRADIAVINGNLIGFEIKSDRDSLRRLGRQIESYDAVFDHSSLIVGPRRAPSVQELVPDWWGVIVYSQDHQGIARFETLRRPGPNYHVDPLSLAQLLWRDEAREILVERGLPGRLLTQRRDVLYECLREVLSLCELREAVRASLMRRTNWRCPA